MFCSEHHFLHFTAETSFFFVFKCANQLFIFFFIPTIFFVSSLKYFSKELANMLCCLQFFHI